MPGRLYGTLYPTPSPSAGIERIWRSTHDAARSPASSGVRMHVDAGPVRHAEIAKASAPLGCNAAAYGGFTTSLRST